MPSTLYLIDGHALAYRSYYALTSGGTASERWLTSSGEPTAGIYGFTSALLRILEKERPDYLAVVFDTGKTFRDELYPEYKATRAKMPEDLRPQIERMRELVDTFNIPRLEVEGYEADDVLGSLARWAEGQGVMVKIITGDKDLLQLVNDRTIVNLPKRSISDAKDYFRDDVKKKMGVWPEQVVDLKAMMGDSSDNIPGVRGVGEKTATALLEEYGTLDAVYENIEDVKPHFRNKLKDGKEDAYLSQKLAQIVTDLPVEVDLERARPEKFDPQKVRDLFRELEFHSLLKRLDTVGGVYVKPAHGEQLSLFSVGEAAPSRKFEVRENSLPESTIQVEIVDTQAGLEALVKRLQGAEEISVDTETTSTDQMQAELVGISLAIEEKRGYYIPVGHNPGLGEQLPVEDVLDALRPALTNPNIPKIGHNIKYDYVILARLGLKISPMSFDTMLAEWVINPASRNLGLKKLAWVRLDHQMIKIEDLIGKGKKQITMAEVAIKDAAVYAADDAAVVLQLKPILEKELEEVKSRQLFDELEMPSVRVLAKMEMTGISLDPEFLQDMSSRLAVILAEKERQVVEAVGKDFNLNSPQQLSEALFTTLRLAPPERAKKTKSGHYSTAAGVLEGMVEQHPVPGWVLEYRELSKLKSTYVDALIGQVNPRTKRIHTSYHQAGTVTGRLASSNPNLQNIPIRTEMGRQVRKAFVASPGWKLVAVDYSQVELRVVAHMAQDEAMIKAFNAGQDIHATTAAAIFGVELEEVSKSQRRQAKAINFGLIYGMSSYGLTRTTDLTLAEAEDFIEAYFERFPGVKQYLDSMPQLAKDQGYVETMLGRRRYFPRLQSTSNYNALRQEGRGAINAPIQGTAADIMKLALLHVERALSASTLSTRILLQVHDELVLESLLEEVNETVKLVRATMESAYQLDVPLVTDARCGANWGSLEACEQSE